MKSATIIVLCAIAAVLASCSKTSEADTRKEQEAGFERAFGFVPSPAITSINYSSRYIRELMDGSSVVWMSFTYDEHTFIRIVDGGYSAKSSIEIPNSKESPSWWRKPLGNATIYTRTQEDTPEDEGFWFEEYLWFDESDGTVFLYKSYRG